jgi:hypothetical protein
LEAETRIFAVTLHRSSRGQCGHQAVGRFNEHPA